MSTKKSTNSKANKRYESTAKGTVIVGRLTPTQLRNLNNKKK